MEKCDDLNFLPADSIGNEKRGRPQNEFPGSRNAAFAAHFEVIGQQLNCRQNTVQHLLRSIDGFLSRPVFVGIPEMAVRSPCPDEFHLLLRHFAAMAFTLA